MKKVLLLSAVLISSGVAMAQEFGRVISSTPVTTQINVPRQVCTTETVAVAQRKSGAGALVGAIAGGAVGNAIGGGSGKTAATMIGLFGGAILGDQIEGSPPSQYENVQRCNVQNYTENRITAYNVVYEYAGRRHSVQMPNDPGRTIRLQVSPQDARQAPVTTTYQRPTYERPAYERSTYEQPAAEHRGRHNRRHAPPRDESGYGDDNRYDRHWR